MDLQLKAQIKENLETSLQKFFRNKEVKHSHLLDLLFPHERRIRSLVGGLETSLGVIICKPIAEVLAKANGFLVEDKDLLMPNPFPELLFQEVEQVKQSFKNNTIIPTEEYVNRLKEFALKSERENVNYVNSAAKKTVDLYLSKDGKEYAFDLKSVQINKRSGIDFKLQLIDWYSYRFCQDPAVNFTAKIVFPVNPYKVDWWKRQGEKAYPLEKGKDAWVQDEFWDFCSGKTDTWAEIIEILDELGKENFGEQFKEIFYR